MRRGRRNAPFLLATNEKEAPQPIAQRLQPGAPTFDLFLVVVDLLLMVFPHRRPHGWRRRRRRPSRRLCPARPAAGRDGGGGGGTHGPHRRAPATGHPRRAHPPGRRPSPSSSAAAAPRGPRAARPAPPPPPPPLPPALGAPRGRGPARPHASRRAHAQPSRPALRGPPGAGGRALAAGGSGLAALARPAARRLRPPPRTHTPGGAAGTAGQRGGSCRRGARGGHVPGAPPCSRVCARHHVVLAMAAAAGEPGAGGAAEEAFLTFYNEVKQIEKRDSVLTSKNQIDRLTRPGSSYFNLNPFEVLQMDPEATDEEIKKRFRQLSILVHPDKNQDDADRAQKAFEAVDKAYKLLLDQEQKKRALDVIQAGKEYVEHTVKEKKKQLKKDGKPPTVEEDDPEVFKQAVYKQTMKLFAELEIKRKEREAKEMHERKRQREEEIEAQEKAKREREWQKNFEESRDGRVDSWRNFQANTKGKKEKKNRTFLRPPKVKMEQRE
ncbi:dnaJ homolog subfamily C member 8 [Falco biarmicus]|uniref:dnaJ homolog subfamily C member 8 n=1 Tax=Falco biarmicus TaxID=345155 RepID=UPI0024BC6E8A|nr:dnaJ homolog subfamily C member 8 [Falco biarmicus]